MRHSANKQQEQAQAEAYQQQQMQAQIDAAPPPPWLLSAPATGGRTSAGAASRLPP